MTSKSDNRSVLAILTTASLLFALACSKSSGPDTSGAGKTSGPDAYLLNDPYEETSVAPDEYHIDAGMPTAAPWMFTHTHVWLTPAEYRKRKPFTKEEVRSLIHAAYSDTVMNVHKNYSGDTGLTGEKIDYVWIGVFKEADSMPTCNVNIDDKCVAAAEWRSPTVLKRPDALERTEYGPESSKEKWGDGFVVWWSESYFK